MLEKLSRAKPAHLWWWMFSASILGIGIGALLANYLGNWALWIFIIGLVVHLWSMYKVYFSIK